MLTPDTINWSEEKAEQQVGERWATFIFISALVFLIYSVAQSTVSFDSLDQDGSVLSAKMTNWFKSKREWREGKQCIGEWHPAEQRAVKQQAMLIFISAMVFPIHLVAQSNASFDSPVWAHTQSFSTKAVLY